MSQRILVSAFTCTAVLAGAALLATSATSPVAAQSGLARPKITGVAGISVKTKDMATARNFYSTILGLDEAFPTKNPLGGADFVAFKINDKQYVNVSPDLKNDADSRLWYVSFETTRARFGRTSRAKAWPSRPPSSPTRKAISASS